MKECLRYGDAKFKEMWGRNIVFVGFVVSFVIMIHVDVVVVHLVVVVVVVDVVVAVVVGVEVFVVNSPLAQDFAHATL